MCQEATAQCLDGLFDAAAQLFERLCALILCGLGPPLQPAVLRLLGMHTRFVTQQPEEREVSV
jgi:hypothetical protein